MLGQQRLGHLLGQGGLDALKVEHDRMTRGWRPHGRQLLRLREHEGCSIAGAGLPGIEGSRSDQCFSHISRRSLPPSGTGREEVIRIHRGALKRTMRQYNAT
jgi:hypothetical protein